MGRCLPCSKAIATCTIGNVRRPQADAQFGAGRSTAPGIPQKRFARFDGIAEIAMRSNWMLSDWNQPEDKLFAMLSELLHTVLTHPDRAQLTLLISTSGIDPEAADLMISSVAIELVSGLAIDDEPEITLFSDLSAIEWQALLPKIARRVILP
ncbi:MAG: hypothetical protein HC895_10430 [Leptolyngbyaceae cyanobacterium SM1_3_5]|nr:hypothetical protein [Leptolyngbyaceae cyanobacterium SM1_3_5]